jgi:ABC-2 type transport system ATP-binding protein
MIAAPAIETLALAKRFGRTTALADLTMTVGAGEAFGFLGPNGAGKTTAVKLLLGLMRATSGAADVLGAPIGDRETRRAIGYLPELFRYQDWLSAREVLAFHARLIGIPATARKAAIDEALAIVGLGARADSRVASFSKGMQQRLGIAVAILGNPRLVFLDEPTSALDPVGRRDVRGIIDRLRARGATIFLNSHLLTEVERSCDRVAFVDAGRIVAQGTIDDILGAGRGLRLRLGDVDAAALAVLRDLGVFEANPPWYEFRAVDEARVPASIAALVHAGAAIHAVEPSRATLEERFLQLLKIPDDDRHPRDHHDP